MVLTRQEKEKKVIELYHQGKGTREIAKEVGMSFGPIGTIIRAEAQAKERVQERVEKASISTRAYSLFSEGKSLVEVAIELQHDAEDAIRYRKEFWKLQQLDRLSQLYDELREDIWPFVDLYRLSRSAGMGAPQVISCLKIANNELPRVERLIENQRFIQTELDLEKNKLREQIVGLHSTLSDYREAIRQETAVINRLRHERIQLERAKQQVEGKYPAVKSTVQQAVEGLLEQHRKILSLALHALIESLRQDPEKLPVLYYNLSTCTLQNEFPFVITFVNGRLDDRHSEEILEKILVDAATAIYDRMVEELTNKTIVNLVSKSEFPSTGSACHESDENKVDPCLEDRSNWSEIDSKEY